MSGGAERASEQPPDGDGERSGSGGGERSGGSERSGGDDFEAPSGGGDGAPTGGGKPSGLRKPGAAVRGLGAATLALEALVLLLAIQPIRALSVELSGATIGATVALAVVAGLLAGLLGRGEWAWHAGTVLQALVLLAGLLHWSLLGVGVIFALVWAYVLHVRRVILG